MGEMPRDLSEEAVAEWIDAVSTAAYAESGVIRDAADDADQAAMVAGARAVLALVRAKVREAVVATTNRQEVCVPLSENTFTIRDETDDEVVARVMGEEVRRG